jgi:hypothetical protein
LAILLVGILANWFRSRLSKSHPPQHKSSIEF